MTLPRASVLPCALAIVLVACGARTGLRGTGQGTTVTTPDGGEVPQCGALPPASTSGSFDAMLCSAPTCDDVGGAHVCPCADPISNDACGFDAIHDDGHVFSASCDLATGACLCVIDGATCACQSAADPVGLCVLGGSLNCCFPQ